MRANRCLGFACRKQCRAEALPKDWAIARAKLPTLQDTTNSVNYAKRYAAVLAHKYPASTDVAVLQMALNQAAADLALLRKIWCLGRNPTKVRGKVHGRTPPTKRYWRITKRRQRARYALEAAVRLRIDPSELPTLTMPS